MKKLYFVIALVLFFANLGTAKNSAKPLKSEPAATSVICGKVLDNVTGEELPGVAVKLKGCDKVCFTDFEGNYQFKDLPNGKYELKVELISYEKVEQLTMNVGKNEVHELTIRIKPVI
jgi:hypothetical protein